ncbi:ABC transporter, CydDC cysteine exporter family, permease/ATP-binding protein CydC [Deinococcus aerius]|uniref:ABC transporter, CydDC cysteine exporter family, permease/ATP-binding protein CydC n=1 Tax=Deinococcus aerius TaxID=200253 RepID=A0A2I9CR51_9DEIO|nr:thiol reductant ABC exporter subunit CydC [Deinococcus aerius]GBF03949.1 ABC transporter, CydDC cysteine exporter family, permease/ATP-binding protein CydC [Deinococcus aerius]
MSGLWRFVRGGGRARTLGSVLLGAGTVLASVGLLSVSGALISGAALKPESLLVLLPLITSVRLFGISRAALRYGERLVSHDLTFRLLGRVRGEAVAHLARVAPAALVGARGGDLLARVRSDVDELQGVYLRLFAPTLVAALVALVTVALVGFVDPRLAPVTLGLLGLAGVALPALAVRAAAAAGRAQNAARAELGAATLEALHGLPDLVTGGGRPAAEGHFARLLATLEAAETRRARVTGAANAARDALGGCGLIAALLLVGQGVAQGETSGPLLAASALGLLASFEAVGNLGSAWATYGSLRAAAARVDGLRALRPAVEDPERPVNLPADPTLRFEAVRFRYPGVETDVLRDVNLTVRPGERVALVGPSGAGKSTLLGLALRFWDPGAGRVTLGGVDLRDLILADARSRFAWAPQQAEVFGGTLRENLCLAADATDDDLLALLGDLGLDGLLARLPGGLSGWVGEYGAQLSAGERARLSVACALLRPAPVLLLDEPTAHLDPANARRLLRAVEERARDRATLLVTHQPELLGPAWRVVGLG